MAAIDHRHHRRTHPFTLVLIGAAFSLFLGCLASDVAYDASFEIQWTNFASWLNAGGLVFAGLAIVAAFADLLLAHHDRGRQLVLLVVLIVLWVLGFVNALVHAKDGWAAMPAALILSVIVTLLTAVALWLGLVSRPAGELR